MSPRPAVAFWLAAAVAVGVPAASWPRPARAQPASEDLAAARRLFVEALADERDGRLAVALAKYHRVSEVRDTANVRFRAAACLEGLGRLAGAMTEYRAAVRLAGDDRESADTARAALARVEALDRQVARLVIDVAEPAPADAEVRLDGEPVARDALGQPTAVDPGTHAVTATAEGAPPFSASVTLSGGQRAAVRVTLAPLPPPSTAPVASPQGPSTAVPTSAWIAFGTAGLLAAGSVVSLVVRGSDLRTIEGDCAQDPGGALVCPQSSQGPVSSARDRALVLGPVAIGLGAGAAVAAAAGVYLVLSAPRARPLAWVAPQIGSEGVALTAGAAWP